MANSGRNKIAVSGPVTHKAFFDIQSALARLGRLGLDSFMRDTNHGLKDFQEVQITLKGVRLNENGNIELAGKP